MQLPVKPFMEAKPPQNISREGKDRKHRQTERDTNRWNNRTRKKVGLKAKEQVQYLIIS